jgi:glyoxylase-like metal-dependent hydrolase (beta-lactamase superfamily II)
MSGIPFVALDDPRYGEVVRVSPLVRRVIAKNPSKFSYLGTGTYIVGGTDVAVVDPGPRIESHRVALARALEGCTVRAILVTHCHADHSPLAGWLHDHTGAPRVAFGPHAVNPDWVDDDTDPHELDDDELAEAKAAKEAGEETMEESIDLAFEPDVRVIDGDLAAEGDGWTMRAVFTPGHTSNHMAFALEQERGLFTGDHIMGWSTTVITPPDGDMRTYLESLHKVRDRADHVFWPTHGSPVTDTVPFTDAYIEHRVQREAAILAAVRAGTAMIPDMVAQLYAAVPKKLHRAAGRSVLAHLVKLRDDGLVTYDGAQPGVKVAYRPI